MFGRFTVKVAFGTSFGAVASLSRTRRTAQRRARVCRGSAPRRYATGGSCVTCCPKEDLVGVVDASSRRCMLVLLLILSVLLHLLIELFLLGVLRAGEVMR